VVWRVDRGGRSSAACRLMDEDIHDFPGDVVAMDRAFVNAMARAIRARLEHPPGIGLDRRPCTKNPTLVRPLQLPVNGHAMGDAADLGEMGGSGGWRQRPRAVISLAGRADSEKR
jgi:hypothetical protein